MNAFRFTEPPDSSHITLNGTDPFGAIHSRLVARLQLTLRTSETQSASEIAPDAYKKAIWLLLGGLLTVKNALTQLREDMKEPLVGALLCEPTSRSALLTVYEWTTEIIEAIERGLRRAPLPELNLGPFLEAMDHVERQASRFSLGRLSGHVEVLICAVLLLHRDLAAALDG